MTEQQPRRGGWPGPAKPKWTFRPTEWTEAVVYGYIEAHGLDHDRDRSKAINALLARTAPARPDAATGGTPTDTEEPQP